MTKIFPNVFLPLFSVLFFYYFFFFFL